MLWGAALGAAPIIIHLLNKRKFRETEWAAMRFLMQAVKKKSRRIRLEQLILLAVRAMIFLLLALALAEPLVEGLGTSLPGRRRAHRVIVMDSTFSMGFQVANRTRFQQAQDIARQIVENSGQGDAFHLLRIADTPPQLIVGTASFRQEEVTEEIALLELPHGRGEIGPVINRVESLLETTEGVPERKEVYFISDFQQAGWLPESNSRLTEFREGMKRIGRLANVTLIDLGKNGAENSAVTSINTVQPHIPIGRPTQFTVSLRNFGRIPQNSRTLEFFVDGKMQASRRVDLVSGGSVSEIFSHSFSIGGEHQIEVRLQADALDVDNHRYLSVPVRDQLDIVCVNGGRSRGASGAATDFLTLALRPEETSSGSPSPFSPKVISGGELLDQDLRDVDCLFLCNVPLITPAEARMLESFLAGGGGVVIALGDRVDVENYNATLYRDGQGLLPAKIGPRRGDAVERKEAFFFDPVDYRHPIISAFQGNPQAGLASTLTYEYYQLELPPQSPHEVAVRFDNGDPAIIEAKATGADQEDRGRLLLVATSLDDSWGNWALWPSYLPMIREMAQLASSGRTGQREFLVGQPIHRALPSRAFDIDISVDEPDGGTTPARVTQTEAVSELQFGDTAISGIYEVNYGLPLSKTELFAVNVDPAESDLTSLTRDELAAELLPGIGFDYQTDYQPAAAEAGSPSARVSQLSRGFLYAVLYLLFVELLMAWEFRYGLWLLFPPLALVAAFKAWRQR